MIKDMEHYPEWLAKLVIPRQTPQALFSNLGYRDTGEIFDIDHKDLKYLVKQARKGRLQTRKARRSFRQDFLVSLR